MRWQVMRKPVTWEQQTWSLATTELVSQRPAMKKPLSGWPAEEQKFVTE